MNTARYYFDNDDDGHWYKIPLKKKKEWDNYIKSVYHEEGVSMSLPAGITPLDGHPRFYTFTDVKRKKN